MARTNAFVRTDSIDMLIQVFAVAISVIQKLRPRVHSQKSARLHRTPTIVAIVRQVSFVIEILEFVVRLAAVSFSTIWPPRRPLKRVLFVHCRPFTDPENVGWKVQRTFRHCVSMLVKN